MNDNGKFSSDVQKLIKHCRQENNGIINYNKISHDLENLFERASSCPGELPSSIFEYWEKEYVLRSSTLTNEPSEENLNKLKAFFSFLDNSNENPEYINENDWVQLGQLVTYEAEDLPVNILTDLMAIIVDHKAI
ncbi:MAG: hypothetical protein GX677_04830 [Treponema sp.]|nr:hypothetical protein [Treponema sp.]